MPFFSEAYAADHKLTAARDTAKDAFAKAIDWHVGGVTISDGVRSYSIAELFEEMACERLQRRFECLFGASSFQNRALESLVA